MQILRLESTIIPLPRLATRHPTRRWLTLLLGAAALSLLSGCAGFRLAYNNAPQLVWWWVDGYADFTTEQTPAARQAVDSLFEWNRRTQLPEYATLLAGAQAPVLQPTTPAAACRWQAQMRDKLEPSLQYALNQASALVPTLTEANFKAMEKQYAKNNKDARKNYLQSDAEDRTDAAVKRAREGFERLYGDLDTEQLRVVRQGVLASPFNPELFLAERQRRQRDTLQTLRKLQAEQASGEQRLTALRALAQRMEHAPEPDYKAYQQKMVDYNCVFAAQVHNATTPAQREKARERLKGWEGDVRALMAQR